MLRNSAILFVRNVNSSAQRRTVANANNVAFIGIGNMGRHMAGHLLKKGRNVKVFDLDSNATKALAGATICKSPADAAKDSALVVTMLPNGGVVREALFGKDGVLSGAEPGSLIIDSSTIEPLVAQELSKNVKAKGFRFLDCPVSGGVTGAEAGTLTFMVGGGDECLKIAEPYLKEMGGKIFKCGGPGAGQVAKMCNNLILGATMGATAEALNLGIKLGMDAQILTDIFNCSTARSWSSETYNPVPGINKGVPSGNDYAGGFSVSLIAKDLGIATSTAASINAPVPFTGLAQQMYRTLAAYGMGNKDFSIIYKFLQGVKENK